jgi:ankyrin repeat protein
MTNDVDAARRALRDGADPNGRDKDGFTALHLAAQEYAVDVARLLLDSGAEVDAANVHGNTPLFTAVFNSRGRGELIGLLRGHTSSIGSLGS